MSDDLRALRPVTINMLMPEPVVQAMEEAARKARLAPADWVLTVIAKEVNFAIDYGGISWTDPKKLN